MVSKLFLTTGGNEIKTNSWIPILAFPCIHNIGILFSEGFNVEIYATNLRNEISQSLIVSFQK